ncbi:cyclic nucleotide-binding domain-containing protein [Imperialibacter roseus]|uniref:Cyclic nucleotide-binding domain-containing protein n=1 Tax=Imperialibacter roseus TaxID=1324217 RepID=A0ABZ0IXH7_9BACT|nr:cyclic nucleotide-binding domain-containing protein [Imperialibacter roseus]WOK09222.1 cyclic nucleotide-binding domain-containing protein [Imperialibacter roseus]
MFASITKSLLQLHPFSAHELDLITVRLDTTPLNKGEFLLKAGQVCGGLFFLERGSLVQYRQHDDSDTIDGLYLPGDWVIDNLSFVSRKPALASIAAFEDSTVLGLDVGSIHELIGISPVFFVLGKLLEHNFIGVEGKLSPKSIDEKYVELLTTRPLLFQVFPLKHIASYLQITPETLSRIRSRIK